MQYEIIANRKRPNSFDGLIGQEFVVATLKNAIDNTHIAHSYLFSGPRGIGKTSAARILARALNCPNGPTSLPCPDYEMQDVIEIDGASHTSVSDVRKIREEVLFAPAGGRYKIYIIDEVHMLSNSAFNALLKTIEEPPPYIIFIFATTEIHRVPATIRSRCQHFSFRLIPIDLIVKALQDICKLDNVTNDEESLIWIAKEARGSLRDAYTLLEQAISFTEGALTFKTLSEKIGTIGIDEMNRLADLLLEENLQGSFELIARFMDDGRSIERIVIDMSEYYRNILFIKHGITAQNVLGFSAERFSQSVLKGYTDEQLEVALAQLLDLYRKLRYTMNERFELELILARLSLLPRYVSAPQLVARLEKLERALGGNIAIEAKTAPPLLPQSPPSRGNAPSHGTSRAAAPEAAFNMEGAHAAGGTINEGIYRRLIEALRRAHTGLSAALNRATDWSMVENVLQICVQNSYNLKVASEQKNIIKEELEKLAISCEDVNIYTGDKNDDHKSDDHKSDTAPLPDVKEKDSIDAPENAADTEQKVEREVVVKETINIFNGKKVE